MQSLTARGEMAHAKDAAAVSSLAPRLARAVLAAALASVLLGLCVWRLACVQAGPDPDTDAYGHFSIARQLLDTPFELRIHWVWLPLYHLLLAGAIALGSSLDDIRVANALGAMLPPLLLLWALAGARRDPARAGLARTPAAPALDRGSARWAPLSACAELGLVPLGAALLTAASPLLVKLGTTGQMEVCFATMLMLVVGLLVRQRFAWAAVAASALVLMRYEGWAVAAVVGAVLLYRRLIRRAPIGRGGWACVLAPGACVLAWAALRRLGGEPWFGFILDNQVFAERVLAGHSEHTDLAGLGLALVRYVAIVPWRTFGLAALCALLGVQRTLRRDGIWLVAPGAAILAFLTLSSLTRSQLGLDRHFASVVPFAATWIAHGLARLVERLASVLARPLGGRLGRHAACLALLPFALSTAEHSSDALASWLGTTRDALRQPRDVARFLRSTEPDAHIVCADAAIEVLSELEPERFTKLPCDRQLEARLSRLWPASEVYVVQRARQLRAWARAASVTYGALDGPPDAFVVLRFAAPHALSRAR